MSLSVSWERRKRSSSDAAPILAILIRIRLPVLAPNKIKLSIASSLFAQYHHHLGPVLILLLFPLSALLRVSTTLISASSISFCATIYEHDMISQGTRPNHLPLALMEACISFSHVCRSFLVGPALDSNAEYPKTRIPYDIRAVCNSQY